MLMRRCTKKISVPGDGRGGSTAASGVDFPPLADSEFQGPSDGCVRAPTPHCGSTPPADSMGCSWVAWLPHTGLLLVALFNLVLELERPGESMSELVAMLPDLHLP